MKIIIKILLSLSMTLSLVINSVYSQNILENSDRVQISIGYSNSFHYDAPIVLFGQCIEGCEPVTQDNNSYINFELEYYHKFGKKSEIKTGIGYRKIGFNELAYFGMEGLRNRNFSADFITYSFGYRYKVISINSLNIFLGNDIYLEVKNKELVETEGHYNYKSNFLNKLNWANKLLIGMQVKINQTTQLNINLNFRSAITKYNNSKLPLNKEYYPFSYGFEIGMSKKI